VPKGAPDYTKFVKLMAWDGTNLVPVLVDENGQFYALLKGHNGTRYVPLKVDGNGRIEAVLQGGTVDTIVGSVTVDQSEKDREIKGTDGTTLRTIAVDSQGRMIAVIYGDQAIPVAQDSTGALVALMKGEYSGALKNVAVDDEGRMIMIPTDPADVWGNAISVGNAELAVRLGSPVLFQRFGNVWFVEDFTMGLNRWMTGKSGSGQTPELSTEIWRFGGYSCKCYGLPDTSFDSYIYREEPLHQLVKHGLSVWFTENAGPQYTYFEITFYTGSVRKHFGIRYHYNTKRWHYIDSSDSWTTYDVEALSGALYKGFHVMKLIVDPENVKYDKLFFDQYEFDLSGLSAYETSSAQDPCIRIKLGANDPSHGSGKVYFDGIVLTLNEP